MVVYRRSKRHIVLLLIVLLLYNQEGWTQIGRGGVPHFRHTKSNSISVVTLPSIDEKAVKSIEEYSQDQKNQPFQFAYPIPVNFDPSHSGEWKSLPDGSKIWLLEIQSPGAYSLNLIFSSFRLYPGAQLFLYNPSQTKILGAFTSQNNKTSGIFATVPIPGDRIIVEYYLPKGTPAGSLKIGQVGHDFTGVFSEQTSKDGRFGESDTCNVDINCPEGANWQLEKNAVVRLIINGGELCTGVLVNNTRQDATPFLITAAHCITTAGDANQTIAVFGYESPYCDGPDGRIDYSLSGAVLRATSDNLDFSLASLSTAPPFYFHPYYAGWSWDPNIPANTVCINHPSGDVKKIAVDSDAPETASYSTYDKDTFWNIPEWNTGTTEPGSSGAPLFNDAHLLVGTLSGGDANCFQPVNDYFQKFSASWDHNADAGKQLKVWLDPLNSGTTHQAGLDPYKPASQTCDTTPNYTQGELLIVKPVVDGTADSGYWSGHNSRRFTQYAEKISNSGTHTFSGAIYHVADLAYDAPGDFVRFKVWTGLTKPETLILSRDVPLNNLQDSIVYACNFDTVYDLTGDFWVGYEIFYDRPVTEPLTDQFSVFQVEPRPDINAPNTAMFYKNQWIWFADNTPDEMRISLAIDPILCDNIPWLGTYPLKTDLSEQTRLYPNPACDHLTIDLPEGYQESVHLKLFSMMGTLMWENYFGETDGTIQINLPTLSAGIYYLQINGNRFRAGKKISIIH